MILHTLTRWSWKSVRIRHCAATVIRECDKSDTAKVVINSRAGLILNMLSILAPAGSQGFFCQFFKLNHIQKELVLVLLHAVWNYFI